jgi:hypothetical protein
MRHQPAWRLRNLLRVLDERLRDENRKPRPNGFTLYALTQRKRQIRHALLAAEAAAT